jgi:glutaredoxin
MKQQCNIFFVYASVLILVGGFLFYLIQGHFLMAVLWPCFIALFLWLYMKYFPGISRYMGYGSVADQPATNPQQSHGKVILYTGMGCPFCPLVRKRLKELQNTMGFDLTETDVTLKPDLLITKGIRALPVVEIGGAVWVGNATSQELASFITAHASAS